MSMYCEVDTQFKDPNALAQAISEVSNGRIPLSEIIISEKGENLIGYKGDVREQIANVIVRKIYVGHLSNDIGFLRQEDGTYNAIISEYDRSRKYGDQWLNKVKQSYAYHVLKKEQEKRGRRVSRHILDNGSHRVEISIGR